jgi:hypothetical protein
MSQSIIETIGTNIISIARDNEDFVCSRCLTTAHNLFKILEDTASEEYCNGIAEQWELITERNIKESW